MNKIWEIQKNKKEVDNLRKVDPMSFSDPILSFLSNKGVTTREEIEDLVSFNEDSERNPFDMKDVDKAVKFIEECIQKKKKVVAYGDYDADGISGTTIALKGLRNLGLDINYYINSRFVEGYGITPLGVDNMLSEFPDTEVILTIDNGIVAYEGVEYAISKGLEVLITDHHIANEELPKGAVAVVNPHRLDDSSEFSDICGATVIYKVLYALYFEMGESLDFIEGLVDIVAMATIGDVMPLVDENRYYVKQGVKMLKEGSRMQFKVLREYSKYSLNEEGFAFAIVPIFNASGRLHGKPTVAVDFLMTEDLDEMHRLAKELVAVNDERKALCLEQTEMAMDQIDLHNIPNVIIIQSEEFHEGIVGIIAGRIKEAFYRPAIVLKKTDEGYVGSARSIEEVHIKNALSLADEKGKVFEKYGGHILAAGMTVKADKFDEFEKYLTEAVDGMVGNNGLTPRVKVDARLELSKIDRSIIDEMEMLRPFGQGFESPVFQINDYEIDESIAMKDVHLKLKNKESGIDVISFSGVEHYENIGSPTDVSFLGTPSLNIFRGKINIQLMIIDNNIR